MNAIQQWSIRAYVHETEESVLTSEDFMCTNTHVRYSGAISAQFWQWSNSGYIHVAVVCYRLNALHLTE